MTRIIVGVIVALALVGTVTAGSPPSDVPPGDTYSTEPNIGWQASATVHENETLENRVDELERKNSQLKTKVVSKNNRIKDLEFQLNQQNADFSPGQTQRMKEMGAWNPQTSSPALIIVRDHGFGPVVYQYVGPGNGQHSFNGHTAWTEVAKPKQEVRKSGNFTFSLAWTIPGMKVTHTVGSFAEYETLNQKLEEQLNTPSGFTAWARWNNGQRHNAQTFRSGTLGIALLVIGGLVYGSAWVESKQQIVLNRRKKKKKRKQANNLDFQQSGRFSSIPILGTIIRKWRRR